MISSAPRSQAVGPGIKIGEYILEKKIGEGGMGEVWSAKQPKIGKMVAIKFLSQSLITNQQAVARFVQEARAVNEIQHRNIVDIFSFGELADGRPYFVMEFLKGKSLADHTKEKGPLPFSEILPIFEQVCNALQAGHELNIIHRDLKPDNLFLVADNRSGRGEVPIFTKVLDFGIAKLNAREGESLTGTGAMMGTPSYMSPEQCEGAKAADQGSDLYSLGIILFELLTGRTPFGEPGEGVGVILSRQMYMPVVAPSTMVSGRSIPPEVDAVVLKALAKNPKDRYLFCLDFYEALVKAVGPLASETFASIQGAKPLFDGGAGSSELFSKLASEELAKKTPTHDTMAKSTSTSHPGDFYSGSQDSIIEAPKLAPVTKGLGRFAAISAAIGVVLGFVFFLVSSSPSKNEVTTTVPANDKVAVPEKTQVVAPLIVTQEVKVTPPVAPALVPVTQPVGGDTPKTDEKKPAGKKASKTTDEKKPEPTPEKPKEPKKETPAGPALIFDGE
jgi:eukaryotic-like serine/threonine-protein kinase